MNGVKVVIVGYTTAGVAAASFAKLYDRRAEVLVFERREYPIYHPCSIVDVLLGVLPSWDAIVEEAPRIPGLEVRTSTLVEEVDPDSKKIAARNLRTGKRVEVEYDKLVLATGSKPYVPRSIRIEDPDRVYTIKTLEDGMAVDRESRRSKRVVVVGGASIGIEMAYAMRKRGLEVVLVEYFDQLMPGRIEPKIAESIKRELEGMGIEVVLGQGVEAVFNRGRAKIVSTKEGEYEGDFVIMATGVRPDVELAERAGIEMGETGGIKVNERLETSAPDIYAAGDNTETLDLVTGRPTLSQLATTAFRQGRIAGINAVGGDEKFPGVVNSWIVNLHEFQFGAAGITAEAARRAGFDPVSIGLTSSSKPTYYPDSYRVVARLVVDRGTQRVLGLHIFGHGDVSRWLDVGTQLITKKCTVGEMAKIELAYTPSVRECVDLLHKLAEAALRRFKR